MLTAFVMALVVAFVVVNVYAEAMRHDLNPLKAPLSSYLTGPYGVVQSAGYVGLMLALLLLPAALPTTGYLFVPTDMSAIALGGVVITKWLQLRATPNEHTLLETVHVVSAGIAFAEITVFEAWYAHDAHNQFLFNLAIAAPISAAAFARFAPTQTAVEEKAYTALVTAWLLVALG